MICGVIFVGSLATRRKRCFLFFFFFFGAFLFVFSSCGFLS